ncbi:MAG: excalibur calcium-binding domain-containing protein [Pseudomonadota bacterium]
MDRRLISLPLIISLALAGVAHAAIYKCPSKSGGVEYSTTPCELGSRKEGDTWVNLEDEKKQRARQEELRKEALDKARAQREKGSESYAPLSYPDTQPSAPNGSHTMTSRFQCDGRTHCSQMTSCEEATFFLKNCPSTRMDGDNDGLPCEQQWCR